MRARAALPAALACALLGSVRPADARADEEAAEPGPPVVVAVDFDAIPTGVLPPVPHEPEASPAAPEPAAGGIKLQKVKPPVRKKKKRPSVQGVVAKITAADRTEYVELAPERPAISAMYASSTDGAEFEGESVASLACRRKEPASPVRWETVAVGSEGTATLEVKDLWFHSDTCTVTPGATARVEFKAIAWDGARPWLFAVRDGSTVTFLMPRTDDVNVDVMAGAPLTVRGAFTRVTLPIARWGASSLVAHVPSLELKPPRPPRPAGKGLRADAGAEPEGTDTPAEVAVELVQTMSERAPTLLVRRSPVVP
jgi:hypothetical protein